LILRRGQDVADSSNAQPGLRLILSCLVRAAWLPLTINSDHVAATSLPGRWTSGHPSLRGATRSRQAGHHFGTSGDCVSSKTTASDFVPRPNLRDNCRRHLTMRPKSGQMLPMPGPDSWHGAQTTCAAMLKGRSDSVDSTRRTLPCPLEYIQERDWSCQIKKVL
jgi:hypothetical protein